MKIFFIFVVLASFAGHSWAVSEPVTAQNKVQFLVDGPEYYPVILDMIRNARQNIEVQMFLWCDDESGIAIAEALAAAARHRVRVRVVIDFFNTKEHRKVYAILKGAGIKPLIYNPPSWGLSEINDHFIHEKLLIVDGLKGMVGGANYCDEYMTGKARPLWHDLGMTAEGAVAGEMQKRFDTTWNWMAKREQDVRDGYDELFENPSDYKIPKRKPYRLHQIWPPTPIAAWNPGTAEAQFLYQQPYMDKSEPARMLEAYRKLFLSATKSVVIYEPYLVPHAEFKKILLQTAAKGIEITIVTNSGLTIDTGSISVIAAQSNYSDLLKAKIRILEYEKTTLHGKAVLIDDTKLLIGSHNFTPRSFNHSGEAMIATDDKDAIARFQEMFVVDRAISKEIFVAPSLDRSNLKVRFSIWVGEEGFF